MEPSSPPTPFQTLKLVIEEASLVPEEWTNGPTALIPRKAALLTRDGMVHVISAPQGKFYLHREEGGFFRLTTQPGALPPLPPVSSLHKGDYSWGAAAWDDWHKAARRLKTRAERIIYLARFTAQLPCGECKTHFTAMQAEFPPCYETAEGFFRYSFDSHNRVNARLKKPIFSFDEAEARYPAL